MRRTPVIRLRFLFVVVSRSSFLPPTYQVFFLTAVRWSSMFFLLWTSVLYIFRTRGQCTQHCAPCSRQTAIGSGRGERAVPRVGRGGWRKSSCPCACRCPHDAAGWRPGSGMRCSSGRRASAPASGRLGRRTGRRKWREGEGCALFPGIKRQPNRGAWCIGGHRRGCNARDGFRLACRRLCRLQRGWQWEGSHGNQSAA